MGKGRYILDPITMNLKWKGELPWPQQIWIFRFRLICRESSFFKPPGILPPNGIFFGFNTIKKVGEQAKKLGGKQALLVTDEIMVQLGYADLVKGLLEKEGIKIDIFGKVDPEPHMETADLLYEMVKKAKSDLVIGLGGGSSMDMAKMTSILATNQQTPMELMTKKVVANPALKKILIPTTSGTGSEVSMFFVTSKGHDKYFMGSPLRLSGNRHHRSRPHRFHAAPRDGLNGHRRSLPCRGEPHAQIRQPLDRQPRVCRS